MGSWFKPLSGQQMEEFPRIDWLSVCDWFPKDNAIMTSEKGSMHQELIRHLLEHIESFVRQ